MWTDPLATTTTPLVLTASWQDYSISAVAPFGTPRPVFHTRLTFTAASGDTVDIDDVVMSVSGDTGDTDPPTPDPMTWASVPAATSATEIAMMATAAVDASGVEYYFDCVSGACTDSGWQDSQNYTDTGLPAGMDYAYRVRARDKSANQNMTGFSSTESASTPPSNCQATSSHVTSVVVSTFGIGKGRKRGRATVTLDDNCGDPVTGANVDGTFSGSFNESPETMTTGSNGVAMFETSAWLKGKVSITFCVDAIASAPTYHPGSNVETCDSL